MPLCLGERLDPGWTGLPLGRFAPPGHETAEPVAATQNTLFVWRNGASAARVSSHRGTRQYARHEGVCDLMATDEETFISHLDPDQPGEALLVALPARLSIGPTAPARRSGHMPSRFGLQDPHLAMLARALEQQCRQGEPYGRLYTESISLALTAYVAARYCEGTAATDGPVLPGRLTVAQQRRLQGFVQDNLARNFSVADMARLTGYSDPHFARLFRQTFGVTPHQFVVRERIERAKRLLRQHHRSLSEVALACGFANQSYFSTAFARATGLTPGRYRARD